MPSIKNIIIFVGIGLVMVLVYLFLIKGDAEQANLSSDTPLGVAGDSQVPEGGPMIGQEFLTILLNIKNIKLEDSIFSNPAFLSLKDSSIVLLPDGNEGRPNPFAPIGTDNIVAAPVTCELPQVLNILTNKCITPITCVLPKVLDVPTNTCVNPPTN
jgi:hypothetical protein